ncbi:hypothetical protein H4219_000508 [Mycoemilia scoparia]|uniref:Homologous recombination OB-fold protein OB-fold domain-containing protein n=1 Tax=Mycoemilia scoparia TaxID=417184 RepID=A0A9W8DT32_9FUNG|nr:hypothetical protein H4219_000508 [Mycoemilia scoparia]
MGGPPKSNQNPQIPKHISRDTRSQQSTSETLPFDDDSLGIDDVDLLDIDLSPELADVDVDISDLEDHDVAEAPKKVPISKEPVAQSTSIQKQISTSIGKTRQATPIVKRNQPPGETQNSLHRQKTMRLETPINRKRPPYSLSRESNGTATELMTTSVIKGTSIIRTVNLSEPPGPAGLLGSSTTTANPPPRFNLYPDKNVNSNNANQDQSNFQHSRPPTTDLLRDGDFQGAAWTVMQNELGLPNYIPSTVKDMQRAQYKYIEYTIEDITRFQASRKVSYIIVLIREIHYGDLGNLCVAVDPTGEIKMSISPSATKQARHALCVGAVLVLKNVSIGKRKGWDPCIVVTSESIERIFTPRVAPNGETNVAISLQTSRNAASDEHEENRLAIAELIDSPTIQSAQNSRGSTSAVANPALRDQNENEALGSDENDDNFDLVQLDDTEFDDEFLSTLP